ncbi:SDR family NAD(P)-dependent oxidoreductase [Paeniglutamicibacter antarcticus]|uniref:SDR family NAD(P)-dependent oxidoreductase n=1 Tax=Arthrobacter terrae TaxID=2935737 RepID=A0A931CPF1_9MICC|nr:SDR family NAD(P)-dependent oxidoreductase [Arthrobacter terrae]MBG0740612.1 SDR family NAD(P)-dependent oxidoreductase [Arthrobacter terrae]
MKLDGARVLVTGASSGIGWAVAQALAHAGCSLLLTGTDTNRLSRIAALTGGEAVAADLAEAGGVERLVSAAISTGNPDVVVHCAGMGKVGTVLGQTRRDGGGQVPGDGNRCAAVRQDDGGQEEYNRLFRLNLVAPMRLSQALLPAMLRKGAGQLVFVTSIAGVLGVAGESAYAASKAALGTYASSLRVELAGSGIGVTTVIPGVVDTDFFNRRGVAYQRRFPRPVPPSRVAAAVKFALENNRAQVVVPGWLRLPIVVQACAPQTYARFAGRWG